ncbi:MAG TPA: hypothetical protein VK817_25415 [Trebonia sp.]|jgi:NAD(P)H dehydrogenase (quinone)|nr:hypothetical protein [Trebonia sp.]
MIMESGLTRALRPYLVQAVGGIMTDYQASRLSGLDDNIEILAGRRSMTVGEYARAHADTLNGVSR